MIVLITSEKVYLRNMPLNCHSLNSFPFLNRNAFQDKEEFFFFSTFLLFVNLWKKTYCLNIEQEKTLRIGFFIVKRPTYG